MPKGSPMESTLFHNYVCPMPDLGGTHGGTKNGLDIPGGQKGTPGKMPEVTTVEVSGTLKVNDRLTGGGGDILANPGVRQPRKKMG